MRGGRRFTRNHCCPVNVDEWGFRTSRASLQVLSGSKTMLAINSRGPSECNGTLFTAVIGYYYLFDCLWTGGEEGKVYKKLSNAPPNPIYCFTETFGTGGRRGVRIPGNFAVEYARDPVNNASGDCHFHGVSTNRSEQYFTARSHSDWRVSIRSVQPSRN